MYISRNRLFVTKNSFSIFPDYFKSNTPLIHSDRRLIFKHEMTWSHKVKKVLRVVFGVFIYLFIYLFIYVFVVYSFINYSL